MPPIPTSSVWCTQCGRRSGRIVNMVFVPEPGSTRPLAARSGSRCGARGGRLYLEAEGEPEAEQATPLAWVRGAGSPL
jgi:hypothetical protein